MNQPISNPAGERLDYQFHPAGIPCQTHRIVLIGHGVTGNKDRPWAVALAEACAGSGIDTIRFSFAGNGESEGRFEEATISKEVEDLGAVIDAVAGSHSDIIYVGHSMGGAVGVIRAARDSRLTHLVSLAGMVHTTRFVETEFADVTPDEGVMWEDDACPLSQNYVDDLHQVHSVLGQATEIAVPWLLVHGDEDDVVPIEESREIFEQITGPKQLIELPGADHVFSGEATAPMTRAVTAFLS